MHLCIISPGAHKSLKAEWDYLPLMGKTQLQEFFSSADNKRGLRRLLRESGFAKVPESEGLSDSYVARDVFIDIQNRRIDENVPHRFVFVMELYSPLERLEADHPLFRLFKSLKQPITYGDCGTLKHVEYGIWEYTGIVIPYDHPDKEAEGSLCVEWINGNWCRTVRNLLDEKVEVMRGIDNDRPAYYALLKYFGLPQLRKFPNLEGLEFMSPGELEAIVKSGAYAWIE